MRNVITSGLVTLATALFILAATGLRKTSLIGGGTDLSRCVSWNTTPIVAGASVLTCVVDDQSGVLISIDELAARASVPVMNSGSASDSFVAKDESAETVQGDSSSPSDSVGGWDWAACLAGCGGGEFAQCVLALPPGAPISICAAVMANQSVGVLLCAALCDHRLSFQRNIESFTRSEAEM